MDPIEQQVRAHVERLATGGIDAEVIDIDPALADTAEFCATYGYALDESANAIVVIGKSEPPVYAMCVVLATTRLDVNRVVRKRLGTKKASFAPSDVTAELTGMTIGGVTPLARPHDLPLWIDAAVVNCERIVVGGGSRACKVLGPPEMLTMQPLAEVVEGLATPIPRPTEV